MSGDDAASTDAATGAAATESKQASRQKQAEHRARLRVRQRERVAARLHALIASALAPTVPPPPCARLPMGVCGPHRLINAESEAAGGRAIPPVDWNSLPPSVDPARGGRLGAADDGTRGERKRWQVESIYAVMYQLLQHVHVPADGAAPTLRIAEFGCGSGNVALPLAALLPQCKFTLVDRNAFAVQLAQQRAAAAGLTNVDRFHACAVADVPADETFDLALGMHACGSATDDAQRAAFARGVGYILVPCCVGKLKEAGDAAGPRSRWLKNALGDGGSVEFLTLASAADHKPPPPPPPLSPPDAADDGASRELRTFRITTAKDLVEADRSAAAVEAGYSTLVTKLYPLAASDKNDVLVGLPPTAFGQRAMAFLRQVAERSLTRESEKEDPSSAAAAGVPSTTATAGTREQRGGGIGGAGEAATTTAIPVANVNRVWGGHDGYHIGAAKEAACTYFIKRKKRTCSNRAADGLTVCSLHTPVALQAERVRCKQPAAAVAVTAITASKSLGGEESDAKQPRLEAEAHAGTSSGGGSSRQHRISATQNRMRNPFARNPGAASAAVGAAAGGEGGGGGFSFPEWREAFADVSLPVFLDVGSARGAFVEAMAKHFPQRNYLGVEIRGDLVAEATANPNLHHMEGNVLEPGWLAALLSSLHAAGCVVRVVAVQFPDPWTAAKHRRRRTVSPEVAQALGALLPDGALVYVSSDVPAVTEAAAAALATQSTLVRWRGGSRRAEDAAKEEGGAAKASEAAEARMLTADAEGLLSASPFGGGVVFTEREHVCEKLWRRVFRLLFMRGGSSAASPAAEA